MKLTFEDLVIQSNLRDLKIDVGDEVAGIIEAEQNPLALAADWAGRLDRIG